MVGRRAFFEGKPLVQTSPAQCRFNKSSTCGFAANHQTCGFAHLSLSMLQPPWQVMMSDGDVTRQWVQQFRAVCYPAVGGPCLSGECALNASRTMPPRSSERGAWLE
jgi:hypothetical protein